MHRLGFAAIGLWAVVAVSLAGCGGSTLETVPVSGRITFGGGDWPTEGRINFQPVSAPQGKTLHPGSATFGKDGKYTVMTGQTPGLAPGEYTATIECWETPPSMDNPSAAKSYAPARYSNPSQSGLKLKIEPTDRSKDFSFDVPKQ